MPICSIPDCGKEVRARGWCIKHWKRWYKSGDPLFTKFVRGAGHKNKKGYRETYRDGEKMLEHRRVMEDILGRSLEPWEVVHHKDHDKSNNDPSNLEVMTLSTHSILHHPYRRFVSETHAECKKCGNIKPHEDFSPDNGGHKRLKRQNYCKRCKADYAKEKARTDHHTFR